MGPNACLCPLQWTGDQCEQGIILYIMLHIRCNEISYHYQILFNRSSMRNVVLISYFQLCVHHLVRTMERVWHQECVDVQTVGWAANVKEVMV